MPSPQFSSTASSNNNATYQACSLQAPGQPAIFFPTSEVDIDFDQAVGVHKYPNIPGATIESLARGPIKFRVKALFYNFFPNGGLIKGSGEQWGTLFPDQYKNVLFLLMDEANNNAIKIFVHPVLGQFTVKAVKGMTKITANERNGATIEFDLIEANTSANNPLSQTNLISSGLQAASNFDNAGYAAFLQQSLNANGISFSVPTTSLSQALGQITGALAQVTMSINRVQGMIVQTIYQCQQIVAAGQAVEQAFQDAQTYDQNLTTQAGGITAILGITQPTFNTTAAAQNSSTSSTSVGQTLQSVGLSQQDIQIVLASLNQLQVQAQAAQQNNTSIYLLTYSATVGQLATQLATSVETLLQLNPNLANLVIVPFHTVVIYPSNVGA